MKLVVLDINGVLARNQRNGLMITKRGIGIVNALSKKYQLGLYSSTTGPKVDRFVESSGMSDKFDFVYARDMTLPDIVLGGYATIKPLHVIFKHYPQYDYSNTIIVDDSWEKVRFNPPENILIYNPELDVGKSVDEKFNYLDHMYRPEKSKDRKDRKDFYGYDENGVYDPRIRLGYYHCPYFDQSPREEVEDRKDH